MRTPLTLNIGLNDNLNSELNIHTVCNALASHGFNILASRVYDSPAGNEKTLVACVQTTLSEIECNARLYCVASCLRQDCIAVVNSGRGELIGPNVEAWGEFNPAFFVGLSGLTLEEVETEKPAVSNKIDGWHKEEFVTYLRQTLIPDLYSSGYSATAEDFETAIRFLAQ